MGRKKGIAVVIPALLLLASATEAQAGAAPEARLSAVVAADPTDPPDQGGGDQNGGQNGGAGQNGGQNTGGQNGGQVDPNDPNNGGQNGGQVDPNDPNNGGQNGGDQNGGQNGGQNGQNGQNGDQNGQNGDQNNGQNGDQNGDQNNGNQGDEQQQEVKEGPVAADFVPIQQGQAKAEAQEGQNASTGSFTSRCGTNENEHHNPDNFIVAPGVQNGAHHIHDYVGNLSTDGFSTDESLAAAGTTCAQNDQSTYFWPVMRVRNQQDNSNQAQQSTADGNVGRIVAPVQASMTFKGNAQGDVTAMPRFLRMITGDAKAGTNGTANARAQWTCSGEDRVLTDKYPLCPGGSQVQRVLEFPSCWDGQNTDSANHRTHVSFPDEQGNCQQGTQAIPKLEMTLSYNLPAQPVAFAVDSFPEQGHAPVTDHADFENVMPEGLMQQAVNCINSGRTC
ncbi:DUF1996 domain-containing protein [Actinomadura sp. 6N118]|uniref:DUF1996 domain-containing protein n=1 Tax=Actinomadura sp. 6N118 TaxID=3375151 RepID=UPI0037AC28DD